MGPMHAHCPAMTCCSISRQSGLHGADVWGLEEGGGQSQVSVTCLKSYFSYKYMHVHTMGLPGNGNIAISEMSLQMFVNSYISGTRAHTRVPRCPACKHIDFPPAKIHKDTGSGNLGFITKHISSTM